MFFVVGLSLCSEFGGFLSGDWNEPLELRRHIFYDFDREVISDQLITGGFLWLARIVCYSQLNLTSDRLLSDHIISMPFSAYYVR